MGVTAVHPSQKRVSCDTCRKHKARCQRLHTNDLKCSRCTLIGVECTTGQQKKIGRPRRRMAIPNAEGSPEQCAPNTKANPADHGSTPINESTRNQPASPSESLWPGAFRGNNQVDWDSILSPAIATTSTAHTPMHDKSPDTAAWPDFGVDSFDHNSFLDPALEVYGGSSHMFDSNLDFDIPRPNTYALHTPETTSSPADDCTCPSGALVLSNPRQADMEDVAVSEAMAKLSQMNLDLQVRLSAVENHKAELNFNAIIYSDSPLFIDNATLADFILRTSQEVHLTMMRLLRNRTPRGLIDASRETNTTRADLLPLSPQSSQDEAYSSISTTPSSPYPAAAREPLLAPLALTITSIYTQLITLYELIVEHLATRVERIGSDPIAPIPGLMVGGMPLVKPCTQGMLFAEVIIKILERLEKALGIGALAEGDSAGLLSARQISVLWSELDEGADIMPGQGMLRPARLKKSFERVAVIFRHLSVDL